VASLWASLGYYAIILLAGLQNIPQEYYEACELDGVSKPKQFLYITVPLVTPQIFFVAVISTIGLFQMFDFVFVFGKQSVFVKDSVRTMAFGIYERAFSYNEMGYASATAILFCVIILTVTVIQNIAQKKWVHYE
jgi:multiple sugar transport system permease protein